jgi:hypothetical protein
MSLAEFLRNGEQDLYHVGRRAYGGNTLRRGGMRSIASVGMPAEVATAVCTPTAVPLALGLDRSVMWVPGGVGLVVSLGPRTTHPRRRETPRRTGDSAALARRP